jgi:hypothetical protein
LEGKLNKRTYKAWGSSLLLSYYYFLPRRIPFVLLTNGGGMTEAAKAEQVSDLIDVKVKKKEGIVLFEKLYKVADVHSYSL